MWQQHVPEVIDLHSSVVYFFIYLIFAHACTSTKKVSHISLVAERNKKRKQRSNLTYDVEESRDIMRSKQLHAELLAKF